MRSLSRRLSSAIADDLCIWTFAAELYARAYAGVVSLRREESGPEFWLKEDGREDPASLSCIHTPPSTRAIDAQPPLKGGGPGP